MSATAHRHPRPTPAAFVLLFALSACDNVASSEIATSETGIDVYVQVDPAGEAWATAKLSTDNPALLEVTYLNLEDGDHLDLAVGARRWRMEEQLLVPWGIYQYVATVDDLAGGEELVIGYQRLHDADAPGTRVRIPAPIALETASTTISRRDGLRLTWLGGDGADRVAVRIRSRSQSACVTPVDHEVERSAGGLTVEPVELAVPAGADPSLPCPLLAEVTALADGRVDPAFGRGGTILAGRSRTLELTATP